MVHVLKEWDHHALEPGSDSRIDPATCWRLRRLTSRGVGRRRGALARSGHRPEFTSRQEHSHNGADDEAPPVSVHIPPDLGLAINVCNRDADARTR
jgi:hypothetical protein